MNSTHSFPPSANAPGILSAQSPQERPQPPGSALATTCDGWTLWEHASVTSTNLLAASLPAWNAVRADTQIAGRGRFQRTWISDAGGLWLSAVVPVTPDAPDWRALPLAVGLAVCDALRAAGVTGLRMRWPNDVLVANRKLAGLLIDQFNPALAVAGIGINVRNQPETHDATLQRKTTRLADLLPTPPSLGELTALILRQLRAVVNEMSTAGFSALCPGINQLWGAPREVELDLDGILRRGWFTSVDTEGRLLLSDGCGSFTAYAAHQVRHLTEL